MNLGAFEIALVNQVKLASGLAAGKVIWANQTRDRPVRPFIELTVLSSEVASTHSESGVSNNPTPTAGNEIILTTTDHVDIRVQMRAFSAEVTGSNKAFNLLDKVRQHFGKESCIETLSNLAESIAVVDREAVADATIVLETEHEGRAVWNVRLRVADVTTETTTYIQETVVETTVTQTSGDVVRTITVTAP